MILYRHARSKGGCSPERETYLIWNHILYCLALLAFDGNGSSHAFFLSFLSLCKDNSDGMKRLDQIVPEAICV